MTFIHTCSVDSTVRVVEIEPFFFVVAAETHICNLSYFIAIRNMNYMFISQLSSPPLQARVTLHAHIHGPDIMAWISWPILNIMPKSNMPAKIFSK